MAERDLVQRVHTELDRMAGAYQSETSSVIRALYDASVVSYINQETDIRDYISGFLEYWEAKKLEEREDGIL